MSPARAGVTTITTGTVIFYDGEPWTVAGIEAGRMRRAPGAGRIWRTRRRCWLTRRPAQSPS